MSCFWGPLVADHVVAMEIFVFVLGEITLILFDILGRAFSIFTWKKTAVNEAVTVGV